MAIELDNALESCWRRHLHNRERGYLPAAALELAVLEHVVYGQPLQPAIRNRWKKTLSTVEFSGEELASIRAALESSLERVDFLLAGSPLLEADDPFFIMIGRVEAELINDLLRKRGCSTSFDSKVGEIDEDISEYFASKKYRRHFIEAATKAHNHYGIKLDLRWASP